MIYKTVGILIMLVLLVIASCKTGQELASDNRQYVIIGYVPGFRGALDEKKIDATKLTHINYAFVNVKDSVATLTNIGTDTVNFRKLNLLKKNNPALKILISLGGWSWSENFSDAVLTGSSRKKFAQSNADLVEKYNLDGVDIDWEYPGLRGEDNIFRMEDRENFTLMFETLREELDALGKKTGKKYQLTTAVPDFPEFLSKTDMDKVAQYLDYINIMFYDFYVQAGDTVGHHSNLYPTKHLKGRSIHSGMARYTAEGVPPEKIVLGVPFYGRSWIMQTTDNRGIDRIADSTVRSGGYSDIRDSISRLPGFKRYWDDDAKAPYLFNESKRQLVVYDDEESIALKCDYIKENKLAGVMFWQYASDPKLYLLNELNRHLK